ncbi:MAG: threonylcarbamoyl-AMP synthase [Lachnospiraceae bacterium]|nr:threonylcarbamoyl-AMP synthase [Lachnospiraceae bacterium]
METKIVKVKTEDAALLSAAGAVIAGGGLVAFPTETVYGLGGDALNRESSEKIYAAKGRPSDNPLIVHISKTESAEKIAVDIPEEFYLLAETFWPGPLTMILKKNETVPRETTGGLDTVAIRMPDHPVALAFIEAAGGYVAAPSANVSGRPSPTLARHVIEDMNGRIDMILDGGDVGIGVESTIVDLTGEVPTILRPGYVTEEMLKRVLGKVDTDRAIMSPGSGQAPKAPGMKYRHYAPKGSLFLVEGSPEEVCGLMKQNLAEVKKTKAGCKTGVMASDELLALLGELPDADVKKSLGSQNDSGEIARRLYRVLREFDEEEVEVIYGESYSGDGFGQAVMNRLMKAAGYCIINKTKK